MRVGSLFSGIGGIELGLERAGGFETAWFVECESHAQAVLKKHWPNAAIYGDITTLDFATVPRIDVLTGGFPCQDISNAGKRAGITGNRSSLWKHYLRAISVLRPRLVLAENVAALTKRGLDVVLCDLATLGYDAEWHCIPAAAVGAPHRRDRIIIIAHPNGERCDDGSDNREERHVLCDEDGDASESESERERRFGRVGTISTDEKLAYTNSGMCGRGRTIGQGRDEQEWRIPVEETEQTRNNIRSKTIGCSSVCREERATGQWTTEPDVGRVAHGVPARVDRIKRLGNAVVPQWAQAIGEAIQEEMRRE